MQLMTNNGNLILYAGNIVDVEAGVLRPRGLVTVRRGLIEAVEWGVDPETLPAESDFRLVSLPDLTVMPGMIDCHVHLALDGRDFQAALARWNSPPDWVPAVQAAFSESLAAGLVALRDGGDGGNIGLQARELVQEGRPEGTRLMSCGMAIGRTGRYGSFLGPGVSGVTEACELLDTLAGQGVDWVKVLVSGIVSFKEFGKVGALQFEQGELDTIISYAHSLGLPVMAHASSDEAVRMAVRASADSVEHAYFVTPQTLEMMASSGIPWVPTVVPVANQVLTPAAANHTGASRDIITRTYELQLERIAEGASKGVPLGIGTDAGAAGVLHGQGYALELELYSQAGMTPAEIIKAATFTGAQICGLGEELGSIAPGKQARLIGVKGDPLQKLELLRDIVFLLN